jgi:hypothetical protein
MDFVSFVAKEVIAVFIPGKLAKMVIADNSVTNN